MPERPLRISLENLTFDAERFQSSSGAGWRIRRDAALTVDGVLTAVEIEVRVVDKGTIGAASWPADMPGIDAVPEATIVRAEFNKGGSTIGFRLDLNGGMRVLFRPEQINPQTEPRKEIAAYRLARLLGVKAVPPATFKRVHRDELLGRLAPDAACLLPRIHAECRFDADGYTQGAASAWVPVVVDSRLDTAPGIARWAEWLSAAGALEETQRSLAAQLSSLLLFDVVIDNQDRFTGGNLLVSPDDQILYWMDNGFSFAADPQGHARARAFLRRCSRFSRTFVHALRELGAEALRSATDDLLSADEQSAVLARRDLALQHVDGAIAKHGESAVMCFD
jgi:hypothetical protein